MIPETLITQTKMARQYKLREVRPTASEAIVSEWLGPGHWLPVSLSSTFPSVSNWGPIR